MQKITWDFSQKLSDMGWPPLFSDNVRKKSFFLWAPSVVSEWVSVNRLDWCDWWVMIPAEDDDEDDEVDGVDGVDEVDEDYEDYEDD